MVLGESPTMSTVSGIPHGALRAPRVPLDLRCIILGALGWGTTQVADSLLGLAFDSTHPVAQLMGLVRNEIGRVAFLGDAFGLATQGLWGGAAFELSCWQGVLTAFVFLGIWAIFGGAILRTSALRLTKNQTLRPKDALMFGLRNASTLLIIAGLVAAFAALLAGLNALAGFVMSLWFIGSSVLALVLFPLVLISSVLLVVVLIGGVIGLPMMWAGSVVERNGALEPISRTFSYVSARPFHFFFIYLLLLVVMSLATLVEGFVEDTTKSTLKAGIVRTALDDSVSKSPPEVNSLAEPTRNHERVQQEYSGIADWRNVRDASWADKIGFLGMWFFLAVLLLGFKGYVVYLLLGGTVSLYLMLRREVDGTHEDELTDEDEANTNAQGDRLSARWVGDAPAADASKSEPPQGASKSEPESKTEPENENS